MIDWLWKNVAGPALNTTFAFIPTWVWVLATALALAWAWKTFGWQGLVAIALTTLTLGAYRKGWKDHASLKPPPTKPEEPKPKKPKLPFDWWDRL